MKRLALLFVLVPHLALAATTLTTDGGQTITFADSTIGQYANGDYWILKTSGSLTITRTSPATSGGQNGCEFNFTNLPVWNGNHLNNGASAQQRKHGFDARQSGYLASQDQCASGSGVVSVPTNTTLMLAKSKTTGQVFSNGSSITHYIEVIEPVTIVSSAPSAGDFRPGFAASSKVPPYNKSQIDYAKLLNFAVASVTGEPTQSDSEQLMRWMIYQHTIGVNQWQAMMPTRNVGRNTETGAYGQSIGSAIVDVMTYLSMSHTNAEKETMAIRLVQQAIDIYSQYQAGFHWQSNGGHVWPAKSVLLFGAAMMNDSAWSDAVKTSIVGRHIWDEDQQYFTVSQYDIDTPRQANCSDNVHTDPTQCIPFQQSDLGKSWWCDSYFDYAQDGSDCSRKAPQGYAWIASHHLPIAFLLSKMSLLDEFDNAAFHGYLMSTNSVDSSWFYPIMSSTGYGTWGVCTFPVNSASSTKSLKTYACSLIGNHINDTPIDSSPTSGGSNVAPSVTLTSPSSSTSQVTTSATIVLGGTSNDADGTVVSVTATADCDASVTSGGTVNSWTKTIDLPQSTVCTVSIYATDDDAAVSPTLTVLVLRAPAAGSTLSDTFNLSGSWPAPNPNRWVQMTGALQWSGNQLNANSAVRNFYYLNETASNDQMAAAQVTFTPGANTWAYLGVRGSVSGGNYNGISCTAQNPTSYIAEFVNGVRQQIGSGFATTWTTGQTLACRVIGTTTCLLQNGTQIGCETTSTFASGKTWVGLWGIAASVDNFAGTSLGGGGDVTPPGISIAVPTTNPLLVISSPYTAAAGAASDSVGVTSCTWIVVESGNSGSCGGTSLPATSVSWTIASITLQSTGNGINTLQVTVGDAAGNATSTSTVIRYIPGGPVGTFTYPNAESTWIQRGRIVHLGGTFTASACSYVLLSDVTDPTTDLGPVIATGTDTWSARVALVPGDNTVTVSCMDDNGTGGDTSDDVSLLDRVKVVTSIKNAVRSR